MINKNFLVTKSTYLSLLHVYFKDKAIVRYNQDVIYTIEIDELIAAFGGLVTSKVVFTKL